MKAKRRHELKKNSLAQFFSDLPLYLRFHANKFLIGLIVICLIILLVRYRRNAQEQSMMQTRGSLVSARMAILSLGRNERQPMSDIARISERKKLIGQVNGAIEQLLTNTKDPDDSALRAEAYIARADLNWTLANLGVIPGAVTQPALAMPQSPATYLDAAQGDYFRVLKEYDWQKLSKASALLGLAAIDENRGEWEKAIEHYNKLLADAEIAEIFKTQARHRFALIPRIRVPVYLGSYSSTRPASQPATTSSNE